MLIERQYHGFVYENLVRNKYNITNSENRQYNGYIEDTPVLITTCKKGTEVCLSDIFKISQIKEDIILIVGVWSDFKNNIVDEYICKIPNIFIKSNIIYSILPTMSNLLETISNNESDDQIWKREILKIRTKWNSTKTMLRPRFKRDHKKQKRIQCSIRYNDFIKNIYPYYKIELKEMI